MDRGRKMYMAIGHPDAYYDLFHGSNNLVSAIIYGGMPGSILLNGELIILKRINAKAIQGLALRKFIFEYSLSLQTVGNSLTLKLFILKLYNKSTSKAHFDIVKWGIVLSNASFLNILAPHCVSL